MDSSGDRVNAQYIAVDQFTFPRFSESGNIF